MNFFKAGILILIVVVIYVIVVIASGQGWNPSEVAWNFENSAQFGDSFGPLGALMAAVAAAAAVGAFFAQKQELADARADASEERALSAKRDFEATLFNLIELFRDAAKEIEVSDNYGQNPLSGRDAIKRFVDEKILSGRGKVADMQEAYRDAYKNHQDDLGHYFRILYQIVRYIDESDVKDKALYVRVVRSTLSNSEIVLLGLNCLFGEGEKKFKPLVERYALLHNVSESDARIWNLTDGFEMKAFGDRPKMLARLNV